MFVVISADNLRRRPRGSIDSAVLTGDSDCPVEKSLDFLVSEAAQGLETPEPHEVSVIMGNRTITQLHQSGHQWICCSVHTIDFLFERTWINEYPIGGEALNVRVVLQTLPRLVLRKVAPIGLDGPKKSPQTECLWILIIEPT